MRYVVCGEEAGEDVADETADGVHGEDIEGIVNAEEELELGGIVGAGGSNNTVDNCGPGGHETGTGGDGYETGDDTGAESHGGPFAFETVVHHAPGDSADGGCEIGHDGCHYGAQVGGQSRTGVEAEPANPEEDRADYDVGNVVWTVVKFMSSCFAVSFFFLLVLA